MHRMQSIPSSIFPSFLPLTEPPHSFAMTAGTLSHLAAAVRTKASTTLTTRTALRASLPLFSGQHWFAARMGTASTVRFSSSASGSKGNDATSSVNGAPEQYDVVIVGGGIAGSALACALGKRVYYLVARINRTK